MRVLIGPIAWCLLSAALFGLSPACCKLLLGEQVGPLALASLLYLGAGVGTLPFAFRKAKARPRRSETARLALAVLFGGILGPILLMVGLQKSDAGSVSLLLNFETVATVMLGWLLFREHVSVSVFVSCVLVVLGGVWISLPGEMALNPGVVWVLLACLCWGMDNHLTAVIDGYTPAQTTCVKGLVAGGFNGMLAISLSQNWGDSSLILGGLAVGVFCYGASMVLYVAGAQQLGATQSQMIFASAPFWGLIASWWILSEPILFAQIGGGVLMIVALVVLYRERHGHRHTHPATRHIHWHHHRDGHHEHGHEVVRRGLFGWHIHVHDHEAQEHTHPHRSDIHHRHH